MASNTGNYQLKAGGDRPKTNDLYAVGIIRELSAACATKSTIWMELGLALSLDQSDLNIIEANNRHDVQRCCLTMFNHWLDKQSDANWETLRKALVYVDLEQLASRIKQRSSVPMFPSNTTDPSNADVSVGDKPGPAERKSTTTGSRNSKTVDSSFSEFLDKIFDVLNKEDFRKVRRKCLENLNVVGGISLSTEIVNEIAITKDLHDLFDVLCCYRPYWNWMNIRVIEKMAGNSEEANKVIDYYKEEVYSRKVRDVMSEISNLEVPTDKHTEVKEMWNKEFDDLLMRDIVKRWNEIEKLLEAEGKMLFKNITAGSVEICWLLPDDLVEHAVYLATFCSNQPVEHKDHSVNIYQEFFSESFFLKIGVVIIKDSITNHKVTSLETYEERFSEDDVVCAFFYLLNKLETLWSKSDFSQLKKVCKRDTRLSYELRSKLKNAEDLDETFDLLTTSPFCTWLELRILKRMAVVAGIPEATHMIKTFEECVHSRKCADVQPYFKKEYINPDHLNEVRAKLNENFEHLVVADLIKYCHNLESILQLSHGLGVPADIKEGCLEIHLYIPTYSYLHAFKSAKRNFLKLRSMHIQYLQIGTYPKVYNTSLCKTTEVQSLLTVTKWSNPTQVINHYYVYLKSHMDADSISHMMHYRDLITDDEFKAITNAPNDDKMNLVLLQYVRLMHLSFLFKFIDILQSIETQRSIGHHLELALKSTKNMDSPSLSTKSGINLNVSEDLQLEFLDLIDYFVMEMSTADVAVLVKQCGTMMASDVYKIPLFTPDFMRKLDNCTCPCIFMIYLLPFMSWFDYSILKELAESSKHKEALKLVDLFVNSIDYNKPITACPIPEFSQLVIPLDNSEYTLLATKVVGNFNEPTLQCLISMKRILMQRLEITDHAILLAGLHSISYYIYWLIPNQIRPLVEKKLNQEKLKLWNEGIVLMTLLPVNFFADNDLHTQENIFHVSLEDSVEMSVMQHKVGVNCQEFQDIIEQNQRLKDNNLKLSEDISSKQNQLYITKNKAEELRRVSLKYQNLKSQNKEQGDTIQSLTQTIKSLTIQLEQKEKQSTSKEGSTQDFRHQEKATAAGISKSSHPSGKVTSILNLDKLMNIVCYMQEKWYMVGMRLKIPPTILGDICKECYDNQIPADSADTFCCVKMFRYWLSHGDDISVDTLLNVLDTIVLKYKITSIESALELQLIKNTSPPEKQQQSYLTMISKICVQLNNSEIDINDVLVYLKFSKIDLNVLNDVATFSDLIVSLEKNNYLNKTDLSWLTYIVDYANNTEAQEIIKNYETFLLADKIYWCSNHSTGTFLIGKISNQPESATIKKISLAKSVASEVAGIRNIDSILDSSEVGSVICYWKILSNIEFEIPKNVSISVKTKCKNAGLTHIGKATNGSEELVKIELDEPKYSNESISGMVIDSLCKDYVESMHDIDIDEWPPNHQKTVVNVALIHYKGSRTEQELIEVSKRHKEGAAAVDGLAHHSRVTKDITKLFQTDDTCLPKVKKIKAPKFVLIEGAPGIGKTVLAKKVAYLWAKKELLKDVKILFLLFLRDPELQTITTPEQLIKYLLNIPLDEVQLKNCIKQIMESKVAIVMDGFDAYPIKLRRRSFIADIINHRVFHNSIVVLTSRPTATIYLHGKVDQRIEILGFAQEERDRYITESLDSPEQTRQLQDYLKYQPIINELVYVPLHLAILLYLFKFQSKLPETLTKMNELFILHTIYRSMTKNKLTPADRVTAMDVIADLPDDILDIVNSLSKLAFKGLQSNHLVFSYAEVKAICPEIENDIPGAYNGFGLLQVVQHFCKKGAGTTASFNFLHFTMQEFLAARYVSNVVPYEEQLQLMNKTFWDSVYNFMWMMYVGINGINSQTFVQFVYKGQLGVESTLSNHITSDKLKCLYLFQCFMEAKSERVPKEISSIFCNDEIDFHGLPLLPHHISSLMLYISKYSIPLQSLVLRDCHIGDIGMSILEHFFIANPDIASKVKHIDLFGNNSVLLWNVYCAIFGQQNLKRLNWSSLKGVNVEEIVSVMNIMTVQSLDLSDNHFTNDDAEKIAKVLSNNTTLQEFDFSKNNISTKGATSISESLQCNVTLQHLKISWKSYFINTYHSTINLSQNHMRDGDARIVANILCSNKTVTKLDLSQNNISDYGAEGLAKCIKNNKSLTEMNLSHNRISNVGLSKIAVILQDNQTLKKFDISHNNVSGKGVLAICECLKVNNTLQELNISNNKISRNEIINICAALQTNTMLKILNLSYNTICDDGVICIGKALQTNTTLQTLDISYNKKITGNGIRAFSDCLRKGTNLQFLRISLNDHSYVDFDSMLKSNDMSKMNLGDIGANFISKFLCGNTSMHKLNISHNNISDNGVKDISECLESNYTLQELNISHNNISDNGVEAISKCLTNNDTLQELSISHNNITDIGIISIGQILLKNTTLQVLDVSHNYICDDGAIAISEHLKSNSTLQQFKMSHNLVSDKGIISITEALHINRTLQLLNISHNKLSDDGAVAISECLMNNMSLQELDMSSNKVSDKGIISIAQALEFNRTLKLLDISSNEISDNGVLTFSDCLKGKNIALQHLKISWSYQSYDRHIHLNLNLNAASLKLSPSFNTMYEKYGTTGAILLSSFLYYNTHIQELDISDNNISDNGAIAISESLKNNNNALQKLNMLHNERNTSITIPQKFNTTLQVLNISNNNITDDGAVAISECLVNNKVLQALNMSGNQVSDKGIIFLGKALQDNVSLRIFDVSNNSLTDNGVHNFSDYLKGKNALHHLRISWDNKYLDLRFDVLSLNMSQKHCGTTGAILLSAVLYDNVHVQVLDISNNNIFDDGAVAISELLINNNVLQEINMSGNHISDQGISVLGNALQSNASLKSFDLSNNDLSDNGLLLFSKYLKGKNALHHIRISWDEYRVDLNFNVASLDMSNLQYSSAVAILISPFLYCNIHIQILDISHNNISDDGAIAISESLKSNNTLQQFNISHNKISDTGIISIAKALQINRTLQLLDISSNKISDNGVLTFSDCVKGKNVTLQLLKVSWNYKPNNRDLSLSLNVRSLKISPSFNTSYKKCGATGAILLSAFLYNNIHIQVLDISGNNISDNGAKAISESLKNNNNRLQKVNMSHDQKITIPQELNTMLKVLNISNNNISDDGAVVISECLMNNNVLQELNMSGNKVSDRAITILGKALQENVSLKIFYISNNRLTDNGVYIFSDYLKGKNTLHHLKISWEKYYLDLNFQFTLYFELSFNVISLNMSKLQYGTAGAILLSTFLYHNVHIQILDISHNDISDDGAVAISESFKSNNTLQQFNMSHNLVSDAGIISITEALQYNVSLKILNISHNNLSDNGVVAISKCLMNNNVLQELNMSGNKLSDNVIMILGKALQDNASLKILDISNNNLTDIGVYIFSDYLKGKNMLHHFRISWYEHDCDRNCNVTSLYLELSFNITSLNVSKLHYGDAGAILLSTFLYHNVHVQKLDISHNDISDDGAIAIGNGLKCNSTLQELNVSHNKISDKGIISISEALQSNRTLQLLNISDNNISVDGVLAIGECYIRNRKLRVVCNK